jgi:hypothetical protein
VRNETTELATGEQSGEPVRSLARHNCGGKRDGLTTKRLHGEGYGGEMGTRKDVCERGGYGLIRCGFNEKFRK